MSVFDEIRGRCRTVAEQARREGLAQRHLDNPIQQVYDAMWQPVYPEVEVI